MITIERFSLSLPLLLLGCQTPPALAQPGTPEIIPDATLGSQTSRPQAPPPNSNRPNSNRPNGNRPNGNLPSGNLPNGNLPNGNPTLIEGGARRGEALFHSFEQFNIGENQQVFFANPADINAIISRITGPHPSNINGVLGVLGPADLFLLNPNGILFGPNAQLDLAGSFTASTADSLSIGEVTFSATNPDAVPLLTLNVQPGLQTGLQSGQIQSGPNSPERLIQNQATLTLPPQQQLTFDGGTIVQAGQMIVPGGTVTLRGQGLSLTGTVVTRTAAGQTEGQRAGQTAGQTGLLQLSSPTDLVIQATAPLEDQALSNQALSNQALSNQAIATALQTNAVAISAANDLTIIGPLVSLSDMPLTLTAGNTLSLLAESNAASTLLPVGPPTDVSLSGPPSQIAGNVTLQSGGDLRIENSLMVLGQQVLGQQVLGQQAGPQLTLQAGGDVLLQETPLSSGPSKTFLQLTGNEGLVSIQANNLNAANALILTAANEGSNRGPNIAVRANQNLTLQDSALGTRANSGQTTGSISVQAGQSVRLLGESAINTAPLNNEPVNTGNINIEATADILLESGLVFTQAEANAGDIDLSSRNIILDGALGQSAIATGTIGGSLGNAGNITLNATDSVELIGFVPGPFILGTPQAPSLENVITQSFGNTTVQASAFGSGASGDIEVNANRLVIRDGVFLANTPGFGQASSQSGNVKINANDILLRGLAVIGTGTLGTADAGTLDIHSDRIRLEDGAGIGVSSLSGTGNAGALNIDTQALTVASGSNISANTQGAGNGGTLNIRAQNITVEGTAADGSLPSTLLTDVAPNSTGTGGELRVQTNTLQVLGGGQIRASTQGPGDAGNLDITAGQVTVAGSSASGIPSTLEAQSTGAGSAGTLSLIADQLTVSDGATISTRAQQGNGGNINLVLNDLLWLRRQGQISATAGEMGTSGDGGNITIDTRFMLAPALENSDITANAFAGSGGNITIDANGLLGIAFRNDLTPLSDITASSEFGLDGTVTIAGILEEITPELTPLPTALAAPADQLIVGCLLDEDANFIVTGRGGIPANPHEILNQGLIWQDPRIEAHESSRPTPPSPTPNIIEAQAWQLNEQGQVELLAALNTPITSVAHNCQ